MPPCPYPINLTFFKFQLAISDSICWITSGVCMASEDLGVSWPDFYRWPYSCNLWHQWVSKSFKQSKDCEFLPQTSHIESLWQPPGGNQGNQCRLNGSSTDWPPKRSWWCFGQLIKSLSQLDMNFTTLIMLIFTAILAIGLVSKGLRACWPKLDEIWRYSFFGQNSSFPLHFWHFFIFSVSSPTWP